MFKYREIGTQTRIDLSEDVPKSVSDNTLTSPVPDSVKKKRAETQTAIYSDNRTLPNGDHTK